MNPAAVRVAFYLFLSAPWLFRAYRAAERAYFAYRMARAGARAATRATRIVFSTWSSAFASDAEIEEEEFHLLEVPGPSEDSARA